MGLRLTPELVGFTGFIPFQQNTASWLHLIQHKHHKLDYILYQHHMLNNFRLNTIVNTYLSRMILINHHEEV